MFRGLIVRNCETVVPTTTSLFIPRFVFYLLSLSLRQTLFVIDCPGKFRSHDRMVSLFCNAEICSFNPLNVVFWRKAATQLRATVGVLGACDFNEVMLTFEKRNQIKGQNIAFCSFTGVRTISLWVNVNKRSTSRARKRNVCPADF